MILYHGSNMDIVKIDLSKSNISVPLKWDELNN